MLVLLPGMDGTGALFQPFLSSLPASCEVQIISYPGDRVMSYPELEAYVVNRLPKDRLINLLAESFSGTIALRLSQRDDLNLKSVVLVCSFAFQPLGRLGAMLALLPIGRLMSLRLPASFSRFFLLGQTASADLVALSREAIGRVTSGVLASRLRQALTSRYCAEKMQARCRVVALLSTKDRLLGAKALSSLRQVCSEAEIYPIRAPHFALQAAPEEVMRLLRKHGVMPAA